MDRFVSHPLDAPPPGARDLDTANFTETSLVLTDVMNGFGASPWTQIFTASTPGFFNNIALGASNFTGLTYGVLNDTLTVNWAGTGSGAATTYAANFTFGGAGGVPEPATWAMMILGFGMVGAGMRLRRPAGQAA